MNFIVSSNLLDISTWNYFTNVLLALNDFHSNLQINLIPLTPNRHYLLVHVFIFIRYLSVFLICMYSKNSKIWDTSNNCHNYPKIGKV